MLRSYQSKPATLADKIEAVKYNKDELKKVLDELADRPLDDDMPELDDEVDRACEKILELYEFIPFMVNFNSILKPEKQFLNIDDLKYFLTKNRFKYHFLHTHTDEYKAEHIDILYQLLDHIELKNIPQEMNEETAESLRTKILELCKDDRNLWFAENIALLILAKYWPINEEDYITLEKIAPENRIFTTTAHQFDLSVLIENHRTRDVRYKDNFETAEDKKLLNPVTNKCFRNYDIDHILRMSGNEPKFDKKDPLISLYELCYLKKTRAIEKELSTTDLDYENIIPARIARLRSTGKNQLIANIKKHSTKTEWMGGEIDANEFSSGLGGLLTRGLSIEMFAAFDTEKQEALALSTPSAWQLIDFGVHSKRLFQLNANNLNSLFKSLACSYTTLLKLTQKDMMTIDGINLTIGELLAGQSQSNNNNLKNSV